LNSKESLHSLEQEIEKFKDKLLQSNEQYPLCIGFISHSTFSPKGWNLFENVLEDYSPDVVQFFAGSVCCPSGLGNTDAVKIAHSFGCKVMMQVGTVEEGKSALDYGVNAIIAQGTEAGGHGVRRELGCGTLSLTSQLVELSNKRIKPVPVLAAGGIVDGRDLAAVLALGADGAVLGTRLWASKEAMGPNSFKDALVAANSADDVIRTRAFDTIANSFRSLKWPSPYDSSGVLRNKTTKQWDDDSSLEKALSTSEGFKIVETFKVASETSDPAYAPVYAGKGVGKIHSIESAFEIISRIEQEIVGVISNASKVLPTAPNSGA
jgi:nitronate monooxygenase